MLGFFYLIGLLIWLSASLVKASNKDGDRMKRCAMNGDLTWRSAVDGKTYIKPSLFGYGVKGHVSEDETGDRIIYSDRWYDKGKRLMNYDEHEREHWREVLKDIPFRTVVPVGRRLVLPKIRNGFKSMVYEDIYPNEEGKYHRYVIYRPGYKTGPEFLLNLDTFKIRVADTENGYRKYCESSGKPYENGAYIDEVIRKFNNDEIDHIPRYCIGDEMQDINVLWSIEDDEDEPEEVKMPKWYR